MDRDSTNKRRYPRIYFPEGLVIGGVVAASDSDPGVSAKVLNLSEGGLFFTISREEGRDFQGGRLFLLGLSGPEPFRLSQKLALEIRWVFGDASLESIGYGCEFVDPPPGCLELIRGMISSFLANQAHAAGQGDRR